MYTRRECLMLAAAALLPRGTNVALRAGDATKPMRGAFMILTTPFTASGAVDWDDLVREVEFCDRSGVHGLVWPQGSSGVRFLTRDERMRGLEVLAKAARGKTPALVLGVQGKDTAEMLEYARAAEALAPDALIAMPPTSAKSLDDYAVYFRALAGVTKRPVIVQTSGGAPSLIPSVDLIVALAREFPHLGYVKEESQPLVARMRDELKHRPPMKAIFGANFGANWLYEMRLGLDGVITGNAMYADTMARMWTLHERGEAEPLRDLFSKFLLMRNLAESIPGADLYVMKKRGIFKAAVQRTDRGPRVLEFSADEIAEIEYRFAALKSST
ncbi:MAG TPA: dihydrodipicolinate synthase family protein [Vicinamibacterales bacterium]|nr:dihydrodipicolinate synthase family protein [Vicinamibacterales bacterium]